MQDADARIWELRYHENGNWWGYFSTAERADIDGSFTGRFIEWRRSPDKP